MVAEFSCYVPLLVAFAIELLILLRAYAISSRSAPKLGEKLEERCLTDIASRAKQGLLPDWHRYLSDADRLFESRGDNLRLLASSVLAVGLFGTLGALIMTAVGLEGTPNLEMQQLLDGTLRALSGSAVGVLCHLIIALVLLRRAEQRFLSWQGDFEVRLQAHAEKHEPTTPVLPLLEQELGRIRESLSSGVAGALAKAVAGLPAAVRQLQVNQRRLSTIIKVQGRGLEKAIQLLARDSQVVAKAGKELEPSVLRLTEALSRVETIPTSLEQVLATARTEWLTGLGSSQ
ncbi:MAG TPA: hypothetical protein VGE98_11450, partial [Thermoanaerobaculia bacterium]